MSLTPNWNWHFANKDYGHDDNYLFSPQARDTARDRVGASETTLQPASIILSLCEESSALPQTEELPRVHRILGPQGLPTQRNTAIPFVLTRYALFLDDDVELAHDYIEQMERFFAADPAIVSAFLSNGARGVNYRKRLIGNLMAYRDLLLLQD